MIAEGIEAFKSNSIVTFGIASIDQKLVWIFKTEGSFERNKPIKLEFCGGKY